MERKFTIGSRGSDLALWQTGFVKGKLEENFPLATFDVKIIKTKGDAVVDTALSKIGDKGLFTKEIEHALLEREIDFAVHSLKDLPTVQPDGLKIGAVSARETPNDVFISTKYSTLDELPRGARIATGSLRRRSQLLAYRPDLEIVEIRGNVPTRIERFISSGLDGLILAYVGVHRLGLDAHIKQIVPTEILLPAVGQGVMAIEIRADDSEAEGLLVPLNDPETHSRIDAERGFLRTLEGGCQVPIGAFATVKDGKLELRGFVGSLDGATVLHRAITGEVAAANELGVALAEEFVANGAAEILSGVRSSASASAEVLY